MKWAGCSFLWTSPGHLLIPLSRARFLSSLKELPGTVPAVLPEATATAACVRPNLQVDATSAQGGRAWVPTETHPSACVVLERVTELPRCPHTQFSRTSALLDGAGLHPPRTRAAGT